MSFRDVLERGDDFLETYPRTNHIWRFLSYSTSLFTFGVSKLLLFTCYKVELNGCEKLETALERSKNENRGIMTVMNHMSMVDDPLVWATLPYNLFTSLDNIRWSLGAHNICFKNKFLANYFSLGQVLSTERFGAGPFQGSIDASIRLLSPDDTLDLEWTPHSEGSGSPTKVRENYTPPIIRSKPSWVHVYPEGFVLQLYPPFENSMRYFKWGITRMILEATKPPIVLPIFATGFEKIASEAATDSMFRQILPRNFGSKINVTIGDPLDDNLIDRYREEWRQLVEKYYDPKNPSDLSDELKYGKEAQNLRSRLAAELRSNVAEIRNEVRKLPREDPRFKSPSWWKRFNTTEGKSDPDVKIIGENWAIRRMQKFLPSEDNPKRKDD
ncbi:taz1p [Saccharomyces arboricola H-6]|uniref:Tafazzin family protein n=1 Tax=Saccharomyces arboricola (strain H-6 / AS 2.3317 / CBS 10644) TaxID=1160507 RepID=J8PXW0_SACAR|nr:taz1p [Saccharomyces arboricola H-6]